MSGPAIAILFGVVCAPPCAATGPERAALEQEAARVLGGRGFVVRPAEARGREPSPEPSPGGPAGWPGGPGPREVGRGDPAEGGRGDPAEGGRGDPAAGARPTGPEAPIEPRDVAGALDADRVVVLDLEPSERVLWMTHFARGLTGPWLVQEVACGRPEGRLECPQLGRILDRGLEPRRAEDVDLVSALRAQAKRVGACVLREDDVPIEERIFGRVELDLEAGPSGRVRVLAVAPAHVGRRALGRCLVQAMELMQVGAFEGDPIKLKVPIDLD